MKEIHGSTGFWRRGGEVVFSHRSVLVLEGEVAEAAEEIIRETCKELDIEIITYFLKGSIKN
jgi:hypothetical protein